MGRIRIILRAEIDLKLYLGEKKMNKNLNLVEILKDCPSGMELDCVMYDNVSFDKVSDDKKSVYPIFCYITDEKGNRSGISFTENGYESKRYGAKCVIFPKGKTTWEGFQRPFKDGDVVTCKGINILVACIYKERKNTKIFNHHFALYKENLGIAVNGGIDLTDDDLRFATEEEKQKLFNSIKVNGYKWNPETKTLEKLIEPKFKVGDWVEFKYYERKPEKVIRIENNVYWLSSGRTIMFQDESAWDLATKFNLSTLKPFDKVLTRVTTGDVWGNDFFGYYKDRWFHCSGHIATHYCIPFEGNEHLLGTTNDCDDFYKTWE